MAHAELSPEAHSDDEAPAGTLRLLKALAAYRIAVPKEAITAVRPDEHGVMYRAHLSPLQSALNEWFDQADYNQANALIHFRPFHRDWHLIRSVVDEQELPRELSDATLCPSRLDALACVVDACDRDGKFVTACHVEDQKTIVVLSNTTKLSVERLKLEPFDLAARDRGRTAFKHVRRRDEKSLAKAALKLPGFNPEMFAEFLLSSSRQRDDGNLFLQYPANWAYALRTVLESVGITVKQSQALELVAVYFGADSWHQLSKHRDEPNDDLVPSALTIREPDGAKRLLFFHSPEEALLRAGTEAGQYPASIVVTEITKSLGTLGYLPVMWMNHKKAQPAEGSTEISSRGNWPFEWSESAIAVGENDVWDVDGHGTAAIALAANSLLMGADQLNPKSTINLATTEQAQTPVLGAVLQMLEREGIPASQVVLTGELAIAVGFESGPDSKTRTSATLEVLQLDVDQFHRGRHIAMYKAAAYVDARPDGYMLRIRADYDRDPDVAIPLQNREDLERILDLAFRPDLFCYFPRPAVPAVR